MEYIYIYIYINREVPGNNDEFIYPGGGAQQPAAPVQ